MTGAGERLVIPFDDRETGPNWRSRRGINVGQQERWASAAVGVGLLALALRRPRWSNLLLAAAAGELIYRGATGHCPLYDSLDYSTAGAESKGVHVLRAVTIERSPQDLYSFWKAPGSIARVMKHVESVEQVTPARWRWRVRGPGGRILEWEDEIINDKPDELIAWRSTENAAVEDAGSVRFISLPGGRGTEVRVTMQVNPPAGVIGVQLARLMGADPGAVLAEGLRKLKSIMEAVESPTTDGQPRGRKPMPPQELAGVAAS